MPGFVPLSSHTETIYARVDGYLLDRAHGHILLRFTPTGPVTLGGKWRLFHGAICRMVQRQPRKGIHPHLTGPGAAHSGGRLLLARTLGLRHGTGAKSGLRTIWRSLGCAVDRMLGRLIDMGK